MNLFFLFQDIFRVVAFNLRVLLYGNFHINFFYFFYLIRIKKFLPIMLDYFSRWRKIKNKLICYFCNKIKKITKNS